MRQVQKIRVPWRSLSFIDFI
ncbi:hypothetical protein F383_39125 [Gossypium arboreum]|uniref:Uncharacterized protein n=1 Tax=Gossypium arboreum TaxID=29729 RepID=A0A0B0MFS7_GOSAR|nr:hypothetical protein F383_39125 [Gossypium arboreum]